MRRLFRTIRYFIGAIVCWRRGHRRPANFAAMAYICSRCGKSVYCTTNIMNFPPVQRSYDGADYNDIGPEPTLEERVRFRQAMQSLRELKGEQP